MRWSAFEALAPDLARRGRERLYQFGPGLGFLATVRADGGPRVHPICPNLVEGALYTLVGPSPKQRDLRRDPRFALHSFPAPDRDDEFYVSGVALHVADGEQIARVEAAQQASGATTSGDEALFELRLERALYAEYKPRGEPDNWPPRYHKWIAPGVDDA